MALILFLKDETCILTSIKYNSLRMRLNLPLCIKEYFSKVSLNAYLLFLYLAFNNL